MPIGLTRSSFARNDPHAEPRPHPSDEAAVSNSKWIAWACAYAILIALSLNGRSLWTDEAFSAWLASHRDPAALVHSLLAGDSSDLQMGLYYVYLFGWAKIFGAGEFALRAANLPFILIFSLALAGAAWRVLESRVAWLAAGLLPFIWQYAAEARPYMAVLAFSAVATGSLLASLQSRDAAAATKFQYVCLASIFLGSLFHMLLLLAAAPLLTIAVIHRHEARQWVRPLTVFAAPFLLLGLYFGWTFHRAAMAYDYPHPGLKQMASVFYELAGFSGLGPNRKFSIDFKPYAIPLAAGGLAFASGAVFALIAGWRQRERGFRAALSMAAAVSCIEVIGLSLVTGKQFDVRHLAALLPVLLFLLIEVLQPPGRIATAAIVLLGATWLTSDIRLATAPEYAKEDYRDAVAAAMAIQRQTGAEIALAADPVAPAYYGADVRGSAPCFPFGQSCAEAMRDVRAIGGRWARAAPAADAERWSSDFISSWIDANRKRGAPVAVLLQLDRSHRKSAWWPVMEALTPASRTQVHGFEIVLLGALHQP